MGLTDCPQQQPRGFMDLPPEIRMQIYPIALDATRGSLELKTSFFNLCSACHQVRFEALPLALQERNLDSKRFQEFLEWTQRGKPHHLEMIRKLSVTFSQDCFEALEESPRHAADLCNFIPSTGSLWESRWGPKFTLDTQKMVGGIVTWARTKSANAIASLWSALTSFPNVEQLSLSILDSSQFRPRAKFVLFCPEKELILDMIPSAFPKLLHYTIKSEPLRISYIQRFRTLRHLGWSGYSTSSSEEIASTLCSLKHLDSITFEQPFSRSGRMIVKGRRFSLRSPSITPDIISQLNPLKSFQIIPMQPNTPRTSSRYWVPFINPVMQALLSHSHTLQHLNISQPYSSLYKKKDIFGVLEFVSTSSIPDICLYIKMPSRLKNMDAKHFLRPTTGKAVDIFVSTNHSSLGMAFLELRTGKYLPTAELVAHRKTQNEVKARQTMPHEISDRPTTPSQAPQP